eukprot:5791112-Pyramimonas_sp.AAC.2
MTVKARRVSYRGDIFPCPDLGGGGGASDARHHDARDGRHQRQHGGVCQADAVVREVPASPPANVGTFYLLGENDNL